MTDKQQARILIRELVEKFRALPDKDSYSEGDSQESFILPLFRALGWNTTSRAEMTTEEHVTKGFADFGFYFNGVPAFYMETKSLREDIASRQHVNQAINYAWLKGVTWAVLTNFAGLKVFNAEIKSINPLKDIFLDLSWERYADEDFELLWLLSKESFQQGKINEQAVRYGRMAKKEPVTRLLFAQMTVWRRDLFKEMRAYGNIFKEDTQKLDEAVQRFLDRLIFIRTVEDRRVEQPRLRPLLRQHEASRKKQKNLFQDLLGLFRELDTVYNARLFSQHQLDLLEVHNVPLLEKIIEGLYDAPSGYGTYDFSAISADILGSIYEQYLSFKVIDPEGNQAITLNGKHTKRKLQGIYYTPQYVVRYIVQQTLGKRLAEGADPYKIRVLDPACGSGSFLLEAFDVLDRFLEENGTEEDKQNPRQRRLRILQNNLYGVDLDPQAIEVAQLNLLLRAALERGQLDMLEHLKTGNSLIDDPTIAGDIAFNWQAEFPEVMAEGGFDIVVGNPPYIRIQNLPGKQTTWLSQHYQTPSGNYDIYVPFVERGLSLLNKQGLLGFILPNKFFQSSYGKNLRQMVTQGQHLHEAVNFGDHQIFEDATTYTCILILSSAPSDVFAYTRVENLQGWIDGNGSLKENFKALEGSQDEWNFVMGTGAELYRKITQSSPRLGMIADIFVGVQTSADNVFIMDFVSSTEDTITLRSRAIDANREFEKSLVHPVVSGVDAKRYAPLPERQYILFPYRIENSKAQLITADELEKDYPETWAYLLENKNRLEEREGGRLKDSNWHGYIYLKNMYRQFTEKICVPRLVSRLSAAYDIQGNHVLDNVDVGGVVLKEDFQQHSFLYLLGIINSKLLAWYFPLISVHFRGGFYSANRQYLEKLPIRTINFDDSTEKEKHDRLVNMVEDMLQLKQQHTAAEAVFDDKRHDLARKIERLDREIDVLVYELYGLTGEEINIVETAQ